MSKFCIQCGAQLNDDATFCTSCGASQNAAQSNANANGAGTASDAAAKAAETVNAAADKVKDFAGGAAAKLDKNPYKNYIILGGAGVIVLILVIILFSLLFSGGYKEPIDNMVKYMESGDAEAYRKAMISDKYYKALKDAVDDADDDDSKLSRFDGDVDEYYEDTAEDAYKYLEKSLEKEYGEDISISYSVKSKKEIKDSKLEDFQDDLEDKADKYDLDYEPKVTAGYKVKVKMKIKGDDDDDEETTTVNVYKVDGDWIMDGGLI